MSSETPSPRPPVIFATTHWTRVLASRGSAVEAREALSALCAAYYESVVAVLRGERRTDDQARDLAHAFFESVLEHHGLGGADPARGRFRSYLLGALKHFLANRREHEAREKRGGRAVHVPLDAPRPGDTETPSIPDPAAEPDAAAFDRAWALRTLERAFAVLTADAARSGDPASFEALKPWLIDDAEAAGRTQAQAAAALGWSDVAFRVALHRLRRRFREVVRAEVAGTVSDPADVADELRHLIVALGTPR